jgi:carboxyl-terminal processing protease
MDKKTKEEKPKKKKTIKEKNKVELEEKEEVIKEKNEKKENSSFSNIEVYVIMIICIALGLVIGVCISKYKNDHKGTENDRELIAIYDELKENYYNDLDEDFNKTQIRNMISSLNDPYSGYYEGLCADNYKQDLKNEFIGIGTEVQQLDNGDIIFVNIYEDRPAEKAGIKVDDKLIKVNGKKIDGLDVQDTIKLIKGGKVGDVVEITVRRGEEEKTFKINKDVISKETILFEYLDDEKIGKIIINYFSQTTLKEVKDKLDTFKEKGIKNVAIDLRYTSFGHMDVAKEIADLFLDKGTLLYKEEYKNSKKEYKTEHDKEYNFNLILITNEGTAKASEMLVSALKDNSNVTVIGTKTAGDSTIQKEFELKNGDLIRYTVGKWLTSKGIDVNDNPINPDYEVEGEADIDSKIKEIFNK